MPDWPRDPAIYEINTRPWLEELSRRAGHRLTLADVPGETWDAIARPGIDAAWLMGVWERSPAGREIALANQGLWHEFAAVLPDHTDADIVGSAYCVKSYSVDEHLGGAEGLAAARAELAKRGVRLIVDFVSNHAARDNAWVTEQPGLFVHGDMQDLENDPRGFAAAGGSVFACGRDPFFPPWEDCFQLNPLAAAYREQAKRTLRAIADQADGVRCDMAMLALNDIFSQTWGTRAGRPPETEFWAEVIEATREAAPGFLFVAEAYWDMEWRLQQLGFDYCYDKRLYERLVHAGAPDVRAHLGASLEYQSKLVRFIENHDEERAASVMEPAKERAAAVAIATLPGAKLWHDGQFGGRRTRLPVFLTRYPQEAPNEELQAFYERVLKIGDSPTMARGEWRLCLTEGWPDNQGHADFLAWEWRADDLRMLVTINYAGSPRDGIVRLDPTGLAGRSWHFIDELSDEGFTHFGDNLIFEGLYLALGPWATHVYVLQPA